MKAKVTGVSAWQETPISGTLDIEVPRYVDSEGRASVSRYTGVLNAAKTGWANSLKPSEDLWLIVQGPDDPQGVRGTFRETLVYANRTVVTEFSRVLRSSDLTGLIFDYNEPVFEPEDLNFGEVPLTMRAAAAAIEQQQADHARANTDHQQVVDNLAGIAQDRAATIAATEDARAVVDAVRGDALYLRGEVPGGLRLYSLDPDRIRANSVTLRAAGTAITTSAVRVRFTQ